LPESLEEAARVRADFGCPIMVSRCRNLSVKRRSTLSSASATNHRPSDSICARNRGREAPEIKHRILGRRRAKEWENWSAPDLSLHEVRKIRHDDFRRRIAAPHYGGPGAVDALLANVHPNRIWTENSRFSAITSTSGATASRSHWAKPIDKFLDPVAATIARAEDRFPRNRESRSFKLNRGVGIVIFSWFGYGQGRSLMRRAFAPLLVNTDFRSVPVRPKPAARSLWPQIQSRLSAS
jgi:hypothetical protein